MNNEKKCGMRRFAKGIEISNDTFLTGLNNNDLIIGGAGSCKTGSYVFNLLLNPYGSLVVSDTKGLLHKRFDSYLKSLGYQVYMLDFVNPKDCTMGYNPFNYIETEMDIKKIATGIMPRLDARDPFWEKAGIRYICMLIGFIRDNLADTEQNMKSVIRLHREIMYGNGKLLLEHFAKEHPDAYAAKKFKEMTGTAEADKMWCSIYEFVNEALEPYGYCELEGIFNNSNNIDFRELGRKRTVLFVKGSDNDTSFHILSTIMFNQILQTLIAEADKETDGRLKVPVRVVLDDFASGASIQNFDNVLSIIRSREISASIIIQSLSQLESKYSKAESASIINNCDHILYMAGRDYETSRLVSNYLDKSVHTVLNLPRDKAVVIRSGEGGKIVDKLKAYHVEEDLAKTLEQDILRAITFGKQ